MLAEAAGDADIPPGDRRVIESALAKDPADRPQTMLAFAEAVIAQIIVLLFSWRLVVASGAGSRANHIGATTHHPVKAKIQNESPVPAVTPPSAPPDPAPSPPEQPPTTTSVNAAPKQPAAPRIDLVAATRRELARRVHAVQVCADEDIGSVERLAVAVNIDTAGRVSAHVQDAANTTLSRCLAQVLRYNTPSPPSPTPVLRAHVFKLRATTPRRP
jgi:hypothetical protein